MKFLNLDRALCLSPHPDDVEYSMSATIKKYQDTLFDVFCLSNGTSTDTTSTSKRINEVKEFWKTWTVENVNLFFSHHQTLDEFNEAQLITYIEDLTIKKNNYQMLFVPSAEDSHFEHRLISGIASSLSRHRPLSIFEYRCSSTLHNWIPNLFIDVDDLYAEKIKLLRAAFISQIDSLYFKDNILQLFHNDFISNKKADACREIFKAKTVYL